MLVSFPFGISLVVWVALHRMLKKFLLLSTLNKIILRKFSVTALYVSYGFVYSLRYINEAKCKLWLT